MTSNNTSVPSGAIVFATREVSGAAYLAFDNNDGTYWHNGGGTADKITMDYGVGNAKSVARYSINPYSYNSYAPAAWSFQGSNDGSSWTDLDTRSGVAWDAGLMTFTLADSKVGSYRFYRLNISNSYSGYILVREVRFYKLATGPGAIYSDSISGLSQKFVPACVSISCAAYDDYGVATTTFATNQNVNWIATSTGSTTPIAYSWEGEGLTGENTRIVSISYPSVGLYHATTTITFGSTTLSVACPGTVGSDNICVGDCGQGVTINPPVITDGDCGSADGQTLTSVPSTNRCDAGIPTSVVAEKDSENKDIWSWWCGGINGGESVSCSAFYNPLDVSIECSLSMTPVASTSVSINTNTVWTVTPSASSIKWAVYENSATTTSSFTGNPLNKIFTTIGAKKVIAQIASSTLGVYGKECSATTTVIQSGVIREQ